MLKIGDFSKLSHVSIKALRLYDQMELLKPVHIDKFTGYRYYSAHQLPRLNRILALKDLGFSLEQISKLLDEISPAQIQGTLQLKQAELQRLVAQEQARLQRVAARLQQIEQEDKISDYDVVLKTVAPIKVAAIREIIPNFHAVAGLYDELLEYLQRQGMKDSRYFAGIWHDTAYKETDIDWEFAIAVEQVCSSDRIKVYELPCVEMACVVHNGSYNTINRAYAALPVWIEANGYKIAGSNREVYIVGGNQQDDESYVTEVQFPVEI
ncbi:MerR family transcriptional regulator [Gloeocapsopsis crepidinum LEGE 06123]|uniref:MerR family transcriptional regulator n=1 Tax=Gloeocapsopsis crepidinum LEGE 06123 TaxID=588587 RepID=A0ABR9UNF5_9CHRO|nr:MerR family transcriptional regulator [Gloeocapsopsis crepidinum]MBE9189817.1 MerR family transcriptional regulator [Gloeocapsopsis crepidinum LEGE 06123]